MNCSFRNVLLVVLLTAQSRATGAEFRGLVVDDTTGVTIRESSWLALRSIEPQPDGRKRFAHTAPWFVTLAGQPIAPRREQVEYFISLMEAELTRNRDVLPGAALAEYEQALKTYRDLQPRAK